MKRGKVIYETKDDIDDIIIEDETSSQVFRNAREHTGTINYDVKCTCNNCTRKHRESSYFTYLKRIQHYESNGVRVGSVKALQRRKLKRVYLPETKDTGVGPLDWSMRENLSRERLYGLKEIENKLLGKNKGLESHSLKRLVDKKLSPLIGAKSEYANPYNSYLRKNKADKGLQCKHLKRNLIDVTTQIHSKEFRKPTRIKYFKNFAVNTDFKVNMKYIKSKSTNSYDKNFNDEGTVNSLIQNVHNSDEDYHEGSLSVVYNDLIENILEKQFKKIFSRRARDYKGQKHSITDSMLRRFDKLKSTSNLAIPSDKNILATSDAPLVASQNPNENMISSLASKAEIKKKLNKHEPIRKKSKSSDSIKLSQSNESLEEKDNIGIKKMLKLQKQSVANSCYKKSKLHCVIDKNSVCQKNSDKKERKKFLFLFRKRDSSKELKPKKGLTTGRCEIREGLTLKIGKASHKQDNITDVIKEIKKYDNLYDKNWLYKLNYAGHRNRNRYRAIKGGTNSITNESNRTNKLELKKRSNGWMIPMILLNSSVDQEYWDLKRTIKSSHSCSLINIKVNLMSIGQPILIYNTLEKSDRFGEKSQSTFNMYSDERVYNIVDYEASLPKSITDKGILNDVPQRPSSIILIDKRDAQKSEDMNDSSMLYKGTIHTPCTQKIIKLKTPVQQNMRCGTDNNVNYDVATLNPSVNKTFKLVEVYLRKFCRDWTPTETDLKLHSDLKFEKSLIKPCNVKVKKGNFKSHDKKAGGIRLQPLVSSNTIASVGYEKIKPKTIDESKKKKRKGKHDVLINNAGVRISPKDSLEVLRKRKLYLNSNKANWKNSKELSISLTNSTKLTNHNAPKWIKVQNKHVSITDVVEGLDGPTTPKEIQTEYDAKQRNQNKSLLVPNCHSNECDSQYDKGKESFLSRDGVNNFVSQFTTRDTREGNNCGKSKESENNVKYNKYKKLRRYFSSDKKYASECNNGEEKSMKNITDMLKISSLPRSQDSEELPACHKCQTQNKNGSKPLGFRFKKQPCNKLETTLTFDDTFECPADAPVTECYEKKVSSDKENDTSEKLNKQIHFVCKKITEEKTTNTSHCELLQADDSLNSKSLHEDFTVHQEEKVFSKDIKGIEGLIEITLKLNCKKDVDKNILICINKNYARIYKEKVKSLVGNINKNINSIQKDSNECVHRKGSKKNLHLEIIIGNSDRSKEKLLPKQLPTQQKADLCKKMFDNSLSNTKQSNVSKRCKSFSVQQYSADLLHSLENVNNSYKHRNKFSELELQCEEIPNNFDNNPEQTVQGNIGVFNANPNIKCFNNIVTSNNNYLCELNEQIENRRFKRSDNFSPHSYKQRSSYNKILKSNRHNDKNALALKVIHKVFQCKNELKKNNKVTKKRPAKQFRIIKLTQLTDQVEKETKRTIYRVLKTNNLLNITNDEVLDNEYFKNERSVLNFVNYLCNVKPQNSKFNICKLTEKPALESEGSTMFCDINATIANNKTSVIKSRYLSNYNNYRKDDFQAYTSLFQNTSVIYNNGDGGQRRLQSFRKSDSTR